jgi:hypothetical protein
VLSKLIYNVQCRLYEHPGQVSIQSNQSERKKKRIIKRKQKNKAKSRHRTELWQFTSICKRRLKFSIKLNHTRIMIQAECVLMLVIQSEVLKSCVSCLSHLILLVCGNLQESYTSILQICSSLSKKLKIFGPEIGTSSIDWTQLSRFFLKTETEFSLRNVVF